MNQKLMDHHKAQLSLFESTLEQRQFDEHIGCVDSLILNMNALSEELGQVHNYQGPFNKVFDTYLEILKTTEVSVSNVLAYIENDTDNIKQKIIKWSEDQGETDHVLALLSFKRYLSKIFVVSEKLQRKLTDLYLDNQASEDSLIH